MVGLLNAIHNAEERAEQIIGDAKKKVEKIHADANEEIAKVKRAAENTVAQAIANARELRIESMVYEPISIRVIPDILQTAQAFVVDEFKRKFPK